MGSLTCGVGVGLNDGFSVGVGVGVDVGIGLGVGVILGVGLAVGVGIGVKIGLSSSSAKTSGFLFWFCKTNETIPKVIMKLPKNAIALFTLFLILSPCLFRDK